MSTRSLWMGSTAANPTQKPESDPSQKPDQPSKDPKKQSQ